MGRSPESAEAFNPFQTSRTKDWDLQNTVNFCVENQDAQWCLVRARPLALRCRRAGLPAVLVGGRAGPDPRGPPACILGPPSPPKESTITVGNLDSVRGRPSAPQTHAYMRPPVRIMTPRMGRYRFGAPRRPRGLQKLN